MKSSAPMLISGVWRVFERRPKCYDTLIVFKNGSTLKWFFNLSNCALSEC